jgi:hypothetical protein
MPTSEQLERQAEATRSKIIDSLDELRERLTIDQIMDRTLDFARDGRAGQFVRNLGQQVAENPMPVILIGAGLSWLMLSGRDRTNGQVTKNTGATVSDATRRVAPSGRGVKDQTVYAASEAADSAAKTAEDFSQRTEESVDEWSARMRGVADEISQRAGETVEEWATRTRRMRKDMAQRAGESAEEWSIRMRHVADNMTKRAGESADEWATRMRDIVSDMASRAREFGDAATSALGSAADAASEGYDTTASIARSAAGAIGHSASAVGSGAGRITQFLKDEPLVLAGIGMALGAALGAAFPASEAENRLMGETSDSLKHTVAETAESQWEKGKAVASAAAQKGLDELKHQAQERDLVGTHADNEPSHISEPAEYEVKPGE